MVGLEIGGFEYSKNANQIKDCNKIVTEISYNVLNLPQTLKEYH